MGYDSVLGIMCRSGVSLLLAKDPTTEHVAIDMLLIAWHRVSSTGLVEFPTECIAGSIGKLLLLSVVALPLLASSPLLLGEES